MFIGQLQTHIADYSKSSNVLDSVFGSVVGFVSDRASTVLLHNIYKQVRAHFSLGEINGLDIRINVAQHPIPSAVSSSHIWSKRTPTPVQLYRCKHGKSR